MSAGFDCFHCCVHSLPAPTRKLSLDPNTELASAALTSCPSHPPAPRIQTDIWSLEAEELHRSKLLLSGLQGPSWLPKRPETWRTNGSHKPQEAFLSLHQEAPRHSNPKAVLIQIKTTLYNRHIIWLGMWWQQRRLRALQRHSRWLSASCRSHDGVQPRLHDPTERDRKEF